MAGELSDFGEKALLDHIFAGTPLTPPANLHYGWSSTAPNDDGTNVTEPTGGSYARVPFSTWNAAVNRITTNNGVISFPTATANLGTPNSLVLYDALSGGNFWGFSPISGANPVNDGVTFEIPDGDASHAWTAGALTTFLANALLDHLFGVTIYNRPATLFAGLSTAPTTDGGSVTEPVGNAYARATANDWIAAVLDGANHRTQNSANIQFPEPTGAWGLVTHDFLADASSAGNILWHGALDTARDIQAGNIPRWVSGAYIARMG